MFLSDTLHVSGQHVCRKPTQVPVTYTRGAAVEVAGDITMYSRHVRHTKNTRIIKLYNIYYTNKLYYVHKTPVHRVFDLNFVFHLYKLINHYHMW